MKPMMSSAARFVIAGVGNMLRTDDGVGVAAVRRLQAENERHPLPDTRLVEVGTDVETGLAAIQGAERVLIVDAARGGQMPGPLYLRPAVGDDGLRRSECLARLCRRRP